MNTVPLNRQMFLPNTGLARRNTVFIFLWPRPRDTHALCLAGSPMGQPSYLCSGLFARAPVLGLCFFVSVNTYSTRRQTARCVVRALIGCISMQRYWSSLRYSFLRTVFCWLPIYVVIQLLQRSASPRARLTPILDNPSRRLAMSGGSRKHSSKRSGPRGGHAPSTPPGGAGSPAISFRARVISRAAL